MKRIFAVAVAATVAAAGILTASGSAQAPGSRTITLKELNRGSTFKFVDLPPRARNPRRPTFSGGDAFLVAVPLTTDAGQPLGRGHIHCTVTRPARRPDDSDMLCDAGYATTDGTLFLSAVSTVGATTTTGAVVGGTGAYAGARGTFVSRNTSSGSDDTFTLLP